MGGGNDRNIYPRVCGRTLTPPQFTRVNMELTCTITSLHKGVVSQMTTVVRSEQSTPLQFSAFLGSRIQNGSPARLHLRARVGLFLIAT